MSPFLKRHGFALALAGGMIAFELLMLLLLVFGQPSGWRWLGDTLQTPNDAALHLASIRQGTVFFANPYVTEPQAMRLDPIWSVLALTHRATGASPIALHELARIAFTVILAFSLHAAARSVADTEAHARLASLLMTGGIGLGWLGAVGMALFQGWTPAILFAPDVAGALAVSPVLLGSAKTILSLALLITVVRGIWKSVHDRTRASLGICAAILLLTFLHPSFILLIAAIVTMAWTKKLGRRPAQERTHRPAIIFLLCLLPATAAYAFLMRDPAYSVMRLIKNTASLPSPLGVFFLLAPAIAAGAWIFRRHDREQRFLAVGRWCIAWMLSAVVLFFLPVTWSGMFLEGLMIPLVLLTLPAWVTLFHALPKRVENSLLICMVGITPLFLLLLQAAWLRNPEQVSRFSRPEILFHAWSFLEQRPNAVVLSDDMQVNVWTPAWSGRTVWLGHPAETVDAAQKQKTWELIMSGPDPDAANDALAQLPITHLLLTSPETAHRFSTDNQNGWTQVFREGTVTVLERSEGTIYK